ncbi:MAG: HlyD family efflux transporter periplasmic adaptor subunit [Bdellovibrionales bacterium]
MKHILVFVISTFVTIGSFAKNDVPEVLVEALVMEKKLLQPKLQVPATVEPLVQGRLTAEISGTVTRLRKRLGEKVKQNEAIFYIKNLQVGAEFREYAVRTPVSGEVTALNVRVGAYVEAGQLMGHVIDSRSLLIRAEVPAAYSSKLKAGQKAEFKLGSEQVDAAIIGVAKHIKASTGTASVELQPTSTGMSFVSGSVGYVTIYLDPIDTIAIPVASILEIADKVYVRIINSDDRINLREVELGDMIGQERVLLKGLEPGDEIVVRATDHIREGDPIRRQKPTGDKKSGS